MAFEFSEVTKQQIYQRQSGVCAFCGNRGIANYHHVVPRQSGDPGNMLHGWLANEINGVGLCSFDHQAMHIGDDPEFKIQYKNGAVPPARYFKYAHGAGDKADPAKQSSWEREHARLAKPVWDDLQRRYASSEAANKLSGNMSQPNASGMASVDLAKRRARLRRRDGGFVDLGLRNGKGLSKQQKAGGAMLIGMAIGAASSAALACRNDREQQKDLAEWESWITQQQTTNPSLGYLLAVQYSIFEQGPVEPTVSYILTYGYPAITVEKAAEMMRKDPPDAMLVRSGEYDAGKYIYPEPMLHWYPPRASFAKSVPNQKLRAVMAAMEPPSDKREALQILDGASMAELLEIYPELFKTRGYMGLWNAIDATDSHYNGNRLLAAVKAVQAKQQKLSFGNFKANAAIPLPAEGSADYSALAKYFGADSSSKGLPDWLQGWWVVYDGSYYYYYFSPTPAVVYTKTKPASGSSPAPMNPANRGSVSLTENGCRITWTPKDSTGPTIEKFWQIHGKGDEMNGDSNKYYPLFARKIQ